jgi:hypothetical protein
MDMDFPSSDAGSGKLTHYAYSMIPRNKRVTMVLAGSDAGQDVLREVLAKGHVNVETFIARRTQEEERTDAPVPVRLFVDSRMTGLVGYVPRGLEPAALEAVARLEDRGRSARVPATIVKTRNGLRVKLLMGLTR